MKVTPIAIGGAAVVQSMAVADHRGAFARLFCVDELAQVLGGRQVVQANHSRTCKVGALRGLHFQSPPHAEMKLVRCIRGRVWDVVLDLRAGSPTFLQWHGEELSAANARMLVIPEGCAHGFQVLEPESELLYLHTASYAPEAEGGVRYDDPAFGIRWPLPVAEVSARDVSHPILSTGFSGICL
ncbi:MULTISPECIES: dTDP-4-dehydrorhamnose 3,5-epimerase family protein [Cupriavidus]|uniref:dTDP-4-dehydrorhamnose 3,5-epimerase family protein n=1 Tax=Cupriavidus sp. SK-3 TaxID=1470558 RepID=UPI0004536AE5|nr:dTDP-4-dehydrorhamnose 3,5-epimerase family protein [Cupriavidus sp. SK-3]KDP86758.1 dTDP-4-dehydrorhamnose 3,5-epimerase [Cupriavidus sp. SK-3]